jgi:tryptophan halogenase
MTVPDSLAEKIELFVHGGHVAHYSHGLFLEPSWIAVYLGQGIVPRRHDTRADLPPPDQLARAAAALRDGIAQAVATMPDHRAYLEAQDARMGTGAAA